jgi:hypothetical protein
MVVTIGTVGNGNALWMESLQEQLRLQLQSLGFDSNYAELESIASEAQAARCPVVLYLHNSAAGETGVAWLRTTVERDRCLPVVNSLQDAKTLPSPVSEANAIEYQGRGAAAVVREILALLLLRRRTKRVFLSYRRCESQALAERLHELLGRNRYDVFLDSATIHAGTKFQRALMDWLIDSDVVLVLATPKLSDSRWVLEELQTARTSGVGLLVVRWPEFDPTGGGRGRYISDHIFDSVDSDQILQLTPSDFQKDGRWSPNVSDRVVLRLEEIRNHLVLSRTKDLMSLVLDDAPKDLLLEHVAGSFGDVRVEGNQSQVDAVIRAFPFRPTVNEIHEFAMDSENQYSPRQIYALYHGGSARSIRPLRWLLDAERRSGPETIRLIESSDEIKMTDP